MELIKSNISLICTPPLSIYGKNILSKKTKSLIDFRQRMKEEKLIHPSYSAYLNDENNNNNLHSIFHNCFHSTEVLHWLIEKQLCKTLDDGQDIFQMLEKLKILHHGEYTLGTMPMCERGRGR